MKFTVQYNRDHHPTKTKMFTDSPERAMKYFEKMAADPNVTNLEMLEACVIATKGGESR